MGKKNRNKQQKPEAALPTAPVAPVDQEELENEVVEETVDDQVDTAGDGEDEEEVDTESEDEMDEDAGEDLEGPTGLQASTGELGPVGVTPPVELDKPQEQDVPRDPADDTRTNGWHDGCGNELVFPAGSATVYCPHCHHNVPVKQLKEKAIDRSQI